MLVVEVKCVRTVQRTILSRPPKEGTGSPTRHHTDFLMLTGTFLVYPAVIKLRRIVVIAFSHFLTLYKEGDKLTKKTSSDKYSR